jgi:hypothetical protein
VRRDAGGSDTRVPHGFRAGCGLDAAACDKAAAAITQSFLKAGIASGATETYADTSHRVDSEYDPDVHTLRGDGRDSGRFAG